MFIQSLIALSWFMTAVTYLSTPTPTCLVMSLYFWKSLGPRRSSLVSLLTLTSGYLDLTSWAQKRSSTRATPFPLSWGATRSPSTSIVSPSSITHTDSRAIWKTQDRTWLFNQVLNVSVSFLYAFIVVEIMCSGTPWISQKKKKSVCILQYC